MSTKLFGASGLFGEGDILVTTDPAKLGEMIVKAEVRTIASDHEAKLVRIEIGHAIRCIAGIRNTSLTEAIIDMDLCKTTHRAEKTFLKYARIAGSGTLMKLAENPQISFSVLDEIAASKKPAIREDAAKFMKRVTKDIEEICEENMKDEGVGGEEGKLIVLGVTRNQAVGIIRRVQIEMGVSTKAGNGNSPDMPKPRIIQAKVLQLLNLLRLMFLPQPERDAWIHKHGLKMADVGATMISLQNDLTEAGIIPPEADRLDPHSITGLIKMAVEPVPEPEEEEEGHPDNAII